MTTQHSALEAVVRRTIRENALDDFYPEWRVREILAHMRGDETDRVDAIAADLKLAKEFLYDAASLTLYDVVFYCDDSASMSIEGNGERIATLVWILSKAAQLAASFGKGISVRFMNSEAVGDNLRTASDVWDYVKHIRFTGPSPLGKQFNTKIVERFITNTAETVKKPVLAIVVTDGEPIGEHPDTLVDAVRDARNFLKRNGLSSKAFVVQVAQVGKDPHARDFLASISTHRDVADIIDTTSDYELETERFASRGISLTPGLWLLKVCLGAIDGQYKTHSTFNDGGGGCSLASADSSMRA